MSATPAGSAELLLRLYELRTDPALRASREWFVHGFHPQDAEEAFAMWMSKDSASYRQVTTYWEMAATFVRHGAIDEVMFHAANTEHVAVIAKLGPFLGELRRLSRMPDYLLQLEGLVLAMPEAEARLSTMRKYQRHKAAQVGSSPPPCAA
ncbi:MAG: hypothetical protein JWO05_2655 [Gemmatimonadetes bacterium]|nr:hypothetical protein [Gemmatimonadota bacterium]